MRGLNRMLPEAHLHSMAQRQGATELEARKQIEKPEKRLAHATDLEADLLEFLAGQPAEGGGDSSLQIIFGAAHVIWVNPSAAPCSSATRAQVEHKLSPRPR